eukprot:jgi/Psemu1/14752/gm1.14752_g
MAPSIQREEEDPTRRTERSTDDGNKDKDNDKDNDNDAALIDRRDPYVCVYCGTPCAALYRQLTSSLSSIKVMRCDNYHCQRIVDPYIEREWLLVVIDCILLRPEAYRHVLYNNQDLSWRNDDAAAAGGGGGGAASTTGILQRLVQWTVLSSLIHAYLKWQTLADQVDPPLPPQQQQTAFANSEDDDDDDDDSLTTLLFGIFVVTSILDLLVQWLAIYGYATLVSTMQQSKHEATTGTATTTATATTTTTTTAKPHSLAYQIYLALLLPTAFQVVSVSVLIWENSKTTRALGSLLVACWQSLAVSLVSIHRGGGGHHHSEKDKNKNRNRNNASFAFEFVFVFAPVLVGAVSLVVWRFLVDRFLLVTQNPYIIHLDRWIHRMPCVGFEMDASIIVPAGHSAGRIAPTSLLCLT